MRKLPTVLTEEEILKLLSGVYVPKHKLQLELLYYCGLRVSEMLGVRVKDIDIKQGVLKVVQGKGSKDRLIPIPKPLKQDLIPYLSGIPDPESKLFDTTKRNTQALVTRLAKKFGKDIHAHTLRHSYATHMLTKTGNIELVRDLLGHTDIRTTQIYTHLSTESKRAMVDGVWK